MISPLQSRTLAVSGAALPMFNSAPVFTPVRLAGHDKLGELFEYTLVLKTPDTLAFSLSIAAKRVFRSAPRMRFPKRNFPATALGGVRDLLRVRVQRRSSPTGSRLLRRSRRTVRRNTTSGCNFWTCLSMTAPRFRSPTRTIGT